MPLGVRCVPERPEMPVSAWVAGVEEIVGFVVLRGGGEWCGHAFGFPDRHPGFGLVRFVSRDGPRMPVGVRSVAWRVRGGLRTG